MLCPPPLFALLQEAAISAGVVEVEAQRASPCVREGENQFLLPKCIARKWCTARLLQQDGSPIRPYVTPNVERVDLFVVDLIYISSIEMHEDWLFQNMETGATYDRYED